jgi:hypothetical protein
MLSRAIASDRSPIRFTTGSKSAPSSTSIKEKDAVEEEVPEQDDDDDDDDDQQIEEEEREEESVLEKAARAGILLLEKNEELLHENQALRNQLKAFEASKQLYQEKYHTAQEQLNIAMDQRAKSILENHKLQHLLDQKNQHIQVLEQTMQDKHHTLVHMENFLQKTVEELETYKKANTSTPCNSCSSPSSSSPCSSSSSSSSIFEKRLGQVQEVNKCLEMEIKSLKKELSQNKSKHTQLIYHSQQDLVQLQLTNEKLQEEIDQAKKINEMNLIYMKQLTESTTSDNMMEKKHNNQEEEEEEEGEQPWKEEETATYPAPRGDLNSPLIKCLFDHWTCGDKTKMMQLTDWLHHVIRGTGKKSPLLLEKLSSQVTAGFTQLLVPILREQHDVQVTIYRRDSVQILSDLILKTKDTV